MKSRTWPVRESTIRICFWCASTRYGIWDCFSRCWWLDQPKHLQAATCPCLRIQYNFSLGSQMRRHDKHYNLAEQNKNDVLCVSENRIRTFSCMNGITIEGIHHQSVIIEIWIRLNNTLPPRNKDCLNSHCICISIQNISFHSRSSLFHCLQVLKWLVFLSLLCEDKIKASMECVLHPGAFLDEVIELMPRPRLAEKRKSPSQC